MKSLSRCVACGSARLILRRITKSFGQSLKQLIVVDNVPVAICQRCGESYIKADVLKQIAAMRHRRGDLRTTRVPLAHV